MSTAAQPTGHHDDPSAPGHDRRSVVARQKEEHGGVKLGSAFFGFLTATGMAVLLTALVTAAGAVVGLASNTPVGAAASEATQAASTVGVVGGIILLVILFVSYYCGGYVAARMARFNGVKQGVAVWVWALLVAVLGGLAGMRFHRRVDKTGLGA